MAPFYPPVVCQKQADIRGCNFKFLASSYEDEKCIPNSFLVKTMLAKAIAPTVKRKKTNTPDMQSPIQPCNTKNFATSNIPIESIHIPEDWKQTQGSDTGLYSFSLNGKDDLTFTIRQGHYQVPGEMQHFLKDLLSQPPHDLTAQEIEDFTSTFPQGKSLRNFTFKFAKTLVWNGRKVIESEGMWPKDEKYIHAAGTTEYCLTYDVFGGGEAIGQIYFQASAEDYPKYLDAAKECMKSIKWATER